MSNLAAQRDELDVLQSIFTSEEFKVLEGSDGLGGHFSIMVDLPPDFKVSYRRLGQRNRLLEGAAKAEKMTTFCVTYLPPINLSIMLPSSYPSDSKPNFILSCKWLTGSKLSKLCGKLDQLWEENKGMEILYIWSQFLKTETLTTLHVESCLDVSIIYTRQMKFKENSQRKQQLKMLDAPEFCQKVDQQSVSSLKVAPSNIWEGTTSHPPPPEDPNNVNNKLDSIQLPPSPDKHISPTLVPNNPHEGGQRRLRTGLLLDSRAICDLPITEQIDLSLQQFDHEYCDINFSRSYQECKVCFSSKLGSDCIRFSECGHVFCNDCVRGYFEVQVRDGDVKSLLCLEDKCRTEASPSQVKSLLGEELFAKYDAALLAATLDTMTDIVYCPRRQCQYPVSVEPDEKMGRCPACQFVFCIYCKMTYHGIEGCSFKSEVRKKLVEDYSCASEGRREYLEKIYGRQQIQTMVQNALSEYWVSSNSQNCPRCNVSIEKSSGCNKMTCWKCHCFFCWLCSEQLNPDMPYLHFNNPDSKCFNRLMEGVNLDEDEEEDDDMMWQGIFFELGD